MENRRWGFEAAEDWEYEEITGHQPARESVDTSDTVSGQDADSAVTVHVTLDGEVVAVRLAVDWKRLVDPRALGPSVLAAANGAILHAMAKQVEQVEQRPPARQQPPSTSTFRAVDRTPFTKEDALRLFDAVAADLERFVRHASEVIDHPISGESAGRHVSGTAYRGQVLQVSVDAGWANSARASEIEMELADLLGELRRKSSPADLTKGPKSAAIDELNALAGDPDTLLRRVGLIP